VWARHAPFPNNGERKPIGEHDEIDIR